MLKIKKPGVRLVRRLLPEAAMPGKKALRVLWLAVLAVAACDFDGQPDYEYQTIVTDSIYSDWEHERGLAMSVAEAELARFAKNACRERIANGWSLFKIEDLGEINCERSVQGVHCRKKNVAIECRRIAEFFP